MTPNSQPVNWLDVCVCPDAKASHGGIGAAGYWLSNVECRGDEDNLFVEQMRARVSCKGSECLHFTG